MIVNSGGVLGGTGNIAGAVRVNSGGRTSPGANAGILRTGSHTFAAGSTFAVEIGGTTPGSGYDQLDVTGSVAISTSGVGVALSLTSAGGFVPSAGQAFKIIKNDGTNPANHSGTFEGLPEGGVIANFLRSGLEGVISYVGGDGNDVVITARTLNLSPTNVALSNSQIAENAGTNAVVGSFTTADPNAGDTFTYSLVAGTGNQDNSLFNISGNQLRATSSLNREAAATRSVRVRTTDQDGLSFERAFSIIVLNVNERPTEITLGNATLVENQPGAVVGTVAVIDPDAGDSHTTAVSDNRFEVVGGRLQLKAGHSVMIATEASINLSLTATDTGGLTLVRAFTLAVVPQHPWQNAALPEDINVSGSVTNLDLFVLRAALREITEPFLPIPPGSPIAPPPYYDVSGDDRLSNVDLFLVVTYLRQQSQSAAGESLAASYPELASAPEVPESRRTGEPSRFVRERVQPFAAEAAAAQSPENRVETIFPGASPTLDLPTAAWEVDPVFSLLDLDWLFDDTLVLR